MLVDQATIVVRSGKGGDGHVSFRREKYVPKGGPDGGDGGDGGSVYLVTAEGVDTLLDLAGKHHWIARNGHPGSTKQKHGASAEDLRIRIPTGTLVYDDATGELLADMDTMGAELMVAAGGRGGWGNEHFKRANDQAPRRSTPGELPIEHTLRLELKLIADIGLIGMPNAGKSTLLSRVSMAKPKIADYPFTTLSPNLGIAELSGFRRFIVADIPGLIEGAHRGQGLGMEFLRHIERTRLLVHLVEPDPAAPQSPAKPIEQYHIVRRELAGYSDTLAAKPQIVVLSKADLLPGDAELEVFTQSVERATESPVFVISAATGHGLPALLESCWQRLQVARAEPQPEIRIKPQPDTQPPVEAETA